jgi:glycogen operon protein
MNSGWTRLDFRIPASPSGRPWRRIVDTALSSPEDFLEIDQGPQISIWHTYCVQERSMIILVSEPENR